MSGQWPPEWEDVDDVFGAEHDQPAAEEDARQAEVAAYLASVPAPVLPEGIESRISAAIAAEAASRAAGGLQVATGDHEAAGTSEAQAAPGASSASRNGAGEGSGGTGDGGAGGARPVGPVPARARVRRPRSGPRRSGLRRGRGRWFMLIGPLVAFLVVGGLAYALTITASPTDSSSARPARRPGRPGARRVRHGAERRPGQPRRPAAMATAHHGRRAEPRARDARPTRGPAGDTAVHGDRERHEVPAGEPDRAGAGHPGRTGARAGQPVRHRPADAGAGRLRAAPHRRPASPRSSTGPPTRGSRPTSSPDSEPRLGGGNRLHGGQSANSSRRYRWLANPGNLRALVSVEQ